MRYRGQFFYIPVKPKHSRLLSVLLDGIFLKNDSNTEQLVTSHIRFCAGVGH